MKISRAGQRKLQQLFAYSAVVSETVVLLKIGNNRSRIHQRSALDPGIRIVDTLHERNTKMNELCDGVIAMPGGFGTLGQFFEMLTWTQLGLHKKPIAILNIDGFYDALNILVQTMVDKGFLKAVNQQMLIVSDSIDELLEKMKNYVSPTVGKWISKETV